MAERRSAFAAMPQAAAGEVRLALRESRPGSLLQVAAWSGSAASVEVVLAGLGLGAPALGRAVADPNLAIAQVAPGRFLVAGVVPDLAPRLEATLNADQAAITDLSHGRVVLRLEGAAAADLLAKGMALDLHPAEFPAGRVAQTAIHHIDVLIHRRAADVFDLWALRGFAEALAEWLLDAGLEFGIAFDR